MYLKLIDIFFFVFHIALIFFNLFGWMVPRFRKWNLFTLLATGFSWIVLGIFYGFGYCFLTDWHWNVREKLGRPVESDSYIHFLITKLTPIQVSEETVDISTTVLFVLALAASAFVNFRHARR